MRLQQRHFEHFGVLDIFNIALALALSVWSLLVFPEWQVPFRLMVVPIHFFVPFLVHIRNYPRESLLWIVFFIDCAVLALQTLFFYDSSLRVDELNGEWTHWRKEEHKCWWLGAMTFISFLELVTFEDAPESYTVRRVTSRKLDTAHTRRQLLEGALQNQRY